MQNRCYISTEKNPIEDDQKNPEGNNQNNRNKK